MNTMQGLAIRKIQCRNIIKTDESHNSSNQRKRSHDVLKEWKHTKFWLERLNNFSEPSNQLPFMMLKFKLRRRNWWIYSNMFNTNYCWFYFSISLSFWEEIIWFLERNNTRSPTFLLRLAVKKIYNANYLPFPASIFLCFW